MGLLRRTSSVCQRAVISARISDFVFASFGIGERKLVETLEISGNAAALQADGVARDLGRVRGEDRRDVDFGQSVFNDLSSAETPAARRRTSVP